MGCQQEDRSPGGPRNSRALRPARKSLSLRAEKGKTTSLFDLLVHEGGHFPRRRFDRCGRPKPGFLFHVLDQRAEVSTIVVTTNLPFSERTSVFPEPRLCKAIQRSDCATNLKGLDLIEVGRRSKALTASLRRLRVRRTTRPSRRGGRTSLGERLARAGPQRELLPGDCGLTEIPGTSPD